jgi:CubicO group peptidase (beta-lactamase class C family)
MSPRSTLLTFATLAVVAPPCLAQAAPARAARLAAAYPAIDSLMRDFGRREHVPGIAYGIIVDGRLAHVGTAGLREVASRSPVDTGTVFRIASMTKSFTAAAILQLRDAGRLSLDDPAERYVPELEALRYPTSDSPKITIRQLLSHSAGFPEDNPWGDRQLAVTDAQMSRMLRGGIPFSTAPGTNYEYSNYGFAILGRIVANVSGQPYTRYVAEHILRPLGMRATTLQTKEVPAARLAHGYRWQDEAWLEEEQLPDGAFGSMGGMLTSISDLSRWVGFMLDAWPARDGPERGPLRRASRREMQQVARYTGAVAGTDSAGQLSLNAGGYGFGLRITTTCRFDRIVHHSGGLPGFGSIMRWLPEYGVGIVALGNRTYTGWSSVTNRALELLAQTGGLVPREPEPSPALLARRDQVSRMVARWDDGLADSVAAVNLYLDLSKMRRQVAIDSLRRGAGGGCRNEGPFVVENRLRGRWRMRCTSGDLAVAITLAPTEPPLVQSLEVEPIARDEDLGPRGSCR